MRCSWASSGWTQPWRPSSRLRSCPPPPARSLFQTDRPLGSFGARIALAQRLGLIDPEVEQALHALRKVRNDFAHSTADITLSEPAQQCRLAECYRQAPTNPLWEPLQQLGVTAAAPQTTPP